VLTQNASIASLSDLPCRNRLANDSLQTLAGLRFRVSHEPWFGLLLVFVLVLAGMLVVQLTVGDVKVRPRIIGKVATVLQMIVVLRVLLKWDPNGSASGSSQRRFALAFPVCSMYGMARDK
jgi:hypothetical protein